MRCGNHVRPLLNATKPEGRHNRSPGNVKNWVSFIRCDESGRTAQEPRQHVRHAVRRGAVPEGTRVYLQRLPSTHVLGCSVMSPCGLRLPLVATRCGSGGFRWGVAEAAVLCRHLWRELRLGACPSELVSFVVACGVDLRSGYGAWKGDLAHRRSGTESEGRNNRSPGRESWVGLRSMSMSPVGRHMNLTSALFHVVGRACRP